MSKVIKSWAPKALAVNFYSKIDEVVDFGGTGNQFPSQKITKLLTLTAPEVKFYVKNDEVVDFDGTGCQTLCQK